MGIYGKIATGMLKTSWGIGNLIGQQLQSASLRPSRRARKLGILAPGDPPPADSLGSFQDYRQVLLPKNLVHLASGIFPIGQVVHPQSLSNHVPAYLSWNHLARHSAIIGPSGSGKTSNVIAPWIVSAITQGASVVAVDVRGDLRDEIRRARQLMGIQTPIPTFTWDIDDVKKTTGSWSPLQSISPIDSSSAALVAQSILGEVSPNDPQPFFAQRDHAWLRGLVSLTVARYGRNVHPSVLFQAIRDQQFLADMMQYSPNYAYELGGILRMNEAEFLTATQGIANKISWLADANLYNALNPSFQVNGKSYNLSFDLLFQNPMLLIIGSRISGGERSAIASSLILNQLRLEIMKHFGSNSSRPIFWVLDEAGRYANRIDLAQMLDLFRGANSPICIALQDAQQLSSDSSERERILGNCDTLITLRGTSHTTAEYFSKRLGTLKTPTTTSSLSTRRQPSSITYQDTPILGENEIMNPPVGRYGGVVQLRSSNAHPFLISFG